MQRLSVEAAGRDDFRMAVKTADRSRELRLLAVKKERDELRDEVRDRA